MFRIVIVLLAAQTILGYPKEHLVAQSPGGRIIGGNTVGIAAFPYQLSLSNDAKGIVCGAVLISYEWALTTASCADIAYADYDTNDNTLLVYTRYGSAYVTGGQKKYIKEFIKHHYYNNETRDSDIALVHLNSAISDPNADPIPLSQTSVKSGANVTISGWGRSSADASAALPQSLQAANVTVIDSTTCNATTVTANMFCAGGNGATACDFDEGGPAVSGGVLVGLYSYGGCSTTSAAVYTDVSAFLDWIKEKSGI